MSKYVSLLLGLLAIAPAVVFARDNRPCAKDPFADPRHDPCNPIEYIPSNTLTAVTIALYILVALLQTFSIWKWGAKWMMAMTIGAYTFSLGIGSRFGLHSNPDSQGIYIVEYLFVVLSPCAFIAADYVLLGRLSLHLNAGKHLLVSPRRITLIFLTSDIVTFLIQAAGGGTSISSTDDLSKIKLGSNIFLAGLAIQLVSFFLFCCVYTAFLYRVYRYEPSTWRKDANLPWHRDWRALAGALVISCIGILIRSFYRTIELSQGFKGPLATSEGFFYGLDTYPLFLAICVFVPFWPGRYITPDTAVLPVPVLEKRPSVDGDPGKEVEGEAA